MRRGWKLRRCLSPAWRNIVCIRSRLTAHLKTVLSDIGGKYMTCSAAIKYPRSRRTFKFIYEPFLLWLKFSRAATTVLAARKICADGYAKPCCTYELAGTFRYAPPRRCRDVGTAGAVMGLITLRRRCSLSDSAPHPVLLLQAGRGDINIVVGGLRFICGSPPLEL